MGDRMNAFFDQQLIMAIKAMAPRGETDHERAGRHRTRRTDRRIFDNRTPGDIHAQGSGCMKINIRGWLASRHMLAA